MKNMYFNQIVAFENTILIWLQEHRLRPNLRLIGTVVLQMRKHSEKSKDRINRDIKHRFGGRN